MDRICRSIDVFNEFNDASFVIEFRSFLGSFIFVNDPHATIQKRKFLQPLVDGVEFKLGDRENLPVRFEGGFGASFVSLANAIHRSGRDAPFVLLLINMAVTKDFDRAPFRQEIDDGHTDSVQTA